VRDVRALAIAWKDVRHTYSSISGLVMMLLAPLLLAGAIGAAFGAGDSFSVSPVKTVVVDLDAQAGGAEAGEGGAGALAAGAAITAALTSPGLADLLTVSQAPTAEAARAMVDSGEAGVAVIIPAGLTAALSSASPSPPEVEIYKDPALSVGPAIVTSVVQEVVLWLNGARATASAGAQLAASAGVTDPARLAALAARAAEGFAAQAEAPRAVTIDQQDPVTPGGTLAERPNAASQVLIGMMVFFTLFGASTPARSILEEHRLGTLSRLFTTPTPRGLILSGKYLAVFVVVLAQTVILLVAGRLIFGTHWGEIGPVVVLVICGALVASSLGLLTVSYAKTPAQAGASSAAIFVFLGLISGNFTGTAGIGGTYAIVRKISPLGWLLEGWNHIMFGGSWDSIVLPVVAVLAFTLVFFALATFFFRRRYA
jgi:ABC-2 type transport system permease protein